MSKVSELLEGRSGEIWRVAPEHSVLEAIREMAQRGVGALMVMEGDRLVGILSERDYARKVILEDRSSEGTRVRDIMTANPMTATLSDSISDCMQLMTDNDFRHLPVVDGDRVVGMISIGDLVKQVIKEQKTTIDQLEQYITTGY